MLHFIIAILKEKLKGVKYDINYLNQYQQASVRKIIKFLERKIVRLGFTTMTFK